MADFTLTNPSDNRKLVGTVLAAPKRPVAAVALIHGFGEHAGRYANFARELQREGYAVVALDLHGHGRTTGPRGRVDDYERLREDVDLLVAETHRRHPNVPLVLYGHSMGGGLVLDTLLKRGAGPVAGVVASAPLIETPDAPPAIARPLLRLIRKLKPGFAVDVPISAEKISTLPGEQSRYETDPLNHGRIGVGLALDMTAVGRSLTARADRFPLPLLLMHARGDRLTTFEASQEFAARVPDCNFIAFEGVAHEIHNDTSRTAVIGHLRDFVATLEESP